MTERQDSGVLYKLSLIGEGLTIEKDLDRETAMEVIAVVVGGATPTPTGASSGLPRPATKRTTRRAPKAADGSESKGTRRRRSAGTGMVRDLSMRPSGKKSFKD